MSPSRERRARLGAKGRETGKLGWAQGTRTCFAGEGEAASPKRTNPPSAENSSSAGLNAQQGRGAVGNKGLGERWRQGAGGRGVLLSGRGLGRRHRQPTVETVARAGRKTTKSAGAPSP